MRVFWSLLLVLVISFGAFAQTASSSAQVPRLVRFSGTLSLADKTATTVGVTFALYSDQTGGSPLWLETQSVSVDAQGNYSVLLGSASKDGIPSDLFLTNEAKWLGVKAEGQDEQARVLLVSVPYALKAGDAETLGGKPASAFILASQPTTSSTSTSYINTRSVQTAVSALASSGTIGYIAKFVNTTDVGNSILFDDGSGHIGINTNAPQDRLHVNGNILLKGQTTHSIKMVGTASTGRLGQDAVGFFFSVDTPGKAMRILTTTAGGTLTDNRLVVGSDGKVGIGTKTPSSMLTVLGTIESTTGGFKFPDGSTLTSATAQGTSSFTGNTSNQIINVVQSGTGVAANFTASNATQTLASIQNGAGVALLQGTGVPAAVRGDSTTTSGNAAGVLGTSASYSGYGVLGINNADCPPPPPSGDDPCNSVGTFGYSTTARHGTGVWGRADATTGADNVGVYGEARGDTGTGVFGNAPVTTGDGVGVYGQTDAPSGTGVWGQANDASGSTAGLYGTVFSPAGVGAQLDVVSGANILFGRTFTGTYPNQVFTNRFRIDSTGKGFFNGGTQTGGADFAESVDVMGGASKYQPGDVLMVDESGTRRFALANEAYSTKIAGIYSTKPGVLATPHQDGDSRLENEVPLAIVGIVPCKVSAENGPIKAGDLLVSSSKPGYAMKGTDRSKMLGAVVGKALGALDRGTGVIEVLVSLH